MFTHTVELTVQNATAQQFYNFMISPVSERYRAWWPGEHLDFRIVRHGDKSHLGDIVFMDEYLGILSEQEGKPRRLTGYAIVVNANSPSKITWQMKKAGLHLPVFVHLALQDLSNGLLVKHELQLGYSGIGTILDPLIKLYFNKSFQNALETHCKLEWPRLAKYLNGDPNEN